ncbi:MAG TPA: APC family permease [Anaerolineales bacterium]|nr:APC family permease [Anaerolineales bacterium]
MDGEVVLEPDAGAVYAWVGRSVNPYLGFICAWTFMVLSIAYMVTAAVPIGVATLDMIAPAYADRVFWVTLVGAAWFAAVAILTIKGVHIAATFQKLMTGIELIALTALCGGAIVKFSAHPVNPIRRDWFLPSGFPDFKTFMAGMLVAIFYYFGWDVSSNVAEETTGEHVTPGKSGVLGMVGIMVMMITVTVMAQMCLSQEQVSNNPAAVLTTLGKAVLPAPWGNIAILAVILSTLGAIETQLIQMSRTLFSMGRDRVLHEKLGEIHHKYETPWLAGILVLVFSLATIWISSYCQSINKLMMTMISSVSVMVSFYYGMTGLACGWYYRRTLHLDRKHGVMRGAWPIASAIFLLIVGVMQLPTLGITATLVTFGTIAAGILPMTFYRLKYKSTFYSSSLESHRRQQDLADLDLDSGGMEYERVLVP